MRGLVPGEQSSTTNPVLQLFCRSAEFLTDLYEGTFRIESILTPGAAPVVKVAATPFDSTHKLGIGRYMIPTGDTASWTKGTHRAVCLYAMESGGKTYTQVIEFEILDSATFASGAGFSAYASSLAMLSVQALSTKTVAELQQNLSDNSRRIEQWTRRFFEPRYQRIRISGTRTISLRLNEAIIAIEDVYAYAKYSTGEEWYAIRNHGSFQAFNRHLDGLLSPDDRKDPRLEMISDSYIDNEPIYTFDWPYGHQNIEVRGVFGYTDPEGDESGGRVLIGRTPRVLSQVLTALVYRSLLDPTLSDLTRQSPGSIKSMSTRAQSIAFGGGGVAAGVDAGMSGDPIIDRMLLPLCAPLRLHWTEQNLEPARSVID